MAWDQTQQPWLVVYPQPARLKVYAAGTAYAANILPIPLTYFHSPDKWRSEYPQPIRKVYYEYNHGDFFDTSSIINWKIEVHVDQWLPFWAQPNRPLGSVQGTTYTRSDVLLPEIPSKWLPFISQPSRLISRAHGTAYVAGKAPGTASTADKWQPTFPQPSRTVLSASGTTYAAGNFGSLGAGAVHWLPIIVQAGRPIVPVKGTDFAGPPFPPVDFVRADRWMPTVVQPNRLLGTAQTVEARPSFFNAVPLADKWQPILVQPGRQVVYAKGTDVVQSLFQQPPQTLWRAPLAVQPSRVVVKDLGTIWTAPVSTAPDYIYADKWQPTLVQPGRLILRDLGTVVALDPGGFYQPGDPDPYRGTGAPTGPDPHRGTSTRTIVVST